MRARVPYLAALALGCLLAGGAAAEEEGGDRSEAPEGSKAGGLVGKWYRRVGNTQITLEFHGERLHVSATGEQTYSAHADYRLTQDQVLFGIVTSNRESDGLPDLADHTFSFRFRLDEGMLFVRDFKCSWSVGQGGVVAYPNPGDGRSGLLPPWQGQFTKTLPPVAAADKDPGPPGRLIPVSAVSAPVATAPPSTAPAPVAPAANSPPGPSIPPGPVNPTAPTPQPTPAAPPT
jgi:hypothetical protein